MHNGPETLPGEQVGKFLSWLETWVLKPFPHTNYPVLAKTLECVTEFTSRCHVTLTPLVSLPLQGNTLLFICVQNTSANGSFFFRTRDRNNSNNALSPNERVRLQIHLYSYISDPTKNTPSHKNYCVVFKTWFKIT